MGIIAPTLGINIFFNNNTHIFAKKVTVQIPVNASGYCTAYAELAVFQASI
jgi:hypothetical protein